MFFQIFFLLFSITFWCLCVDDGPKNNGKNKQILTQLEDDYITEFNFNDEQYSHFLYNILNNDNDESNKRRWHNESDGEENGTKKTKRKQPMETLPVEEEQRVLQKKAFANSTGKEKLAKETAKLNSKSQMDKMSKDKGKVPTEENYTKIEAQKRENLAEVVEQFVQKSNKRWAHFQGMIDALLAKEFEEKRQQLAKRKKDEGIELKFLAPIDLEYGKRRNALILSAQTIDMVLFGIEISLSFLGVPSEILQNEVNEYTRLIIRHLACKLAKAQPIFEELFKNIDTFGTLLMEKIGTKNAKVFTAIRGIKLFLQLPNSSLSTTEQQQQVEDDHVQQQLPVPLHNLTIYTRFYRSMAHLCNFFYRKPNVYNEQILREVFGTFLVFAKAMVEQFGAYIEIGKKKGIGQMKSAICQ